MNEKGNDATMQTPTATSRASVLSPTIRITREAFLFNKGALILLIIIILISPWVGFVFPGFLGMGLSYILAIVGLVVGVIAITKLREIKEFS